jgi:hypothetical protein
VPYGRIHTRMAVLMHRMEPYDGRDPKTSPNSKALALQTALTLAATSTRCCYKLSPSTMVSIVPSVRIDGSFCCTKISFPAVSSPRALRLDTKIISSCLYRRDVGCRRLRVGDIDVEPLDRTLGLTVGL